MSKLPIPLFALCSLALSPAAAFAQAAPYAADQANDQANDTYVLPTFRVESETVDRYRAADAASAVRIRTSLIETPSTISVLTRELLEDVAPVRILDAARYTASVQGNRGMAFAGTMTLRGFDLVWRTIDNFFDPAGYLMEPAVIERIEISKGPNAIMAPGTSPGGHINIVTKAPDFSRKSEISGMIGNWDADKYSIDITSPLGDSDRFAYRVVGVYQDTHRYWSKDQPKTRKIFTPSFVWRINPTTELLLRYNYYNTAELRAPNMVLDSSVVQRGQKPILAPGFSPRSLNGVPPWSVLNYAGGTASAHLKTSFNKNVTMRLAAFAHRSGEDSSYVRANHPSNPSHPGLQKRYHPETGIMTPDYFWELQDPNLDYDEASNPYVSTYSPYVDPTALRYRPERVITSWVKAHVVQNDWVFNFAPEWAKLQTVTGWTYDRRTNENIAARGTLPTYSLYDLENQDLTAVWDVNPFRNYKNTDEKIHLYLSQRVSFWEDRIAITGSAFSYHTKSRNHNRLTSTTTSQKDTKDMYMWNALYRVQPNISLYYGYSTNAAPTSIDDKRLWREGKQSEYGIKTEFLNRRLAINFAYFEIEESNITAGNPEYKAGNFDVPEIMITDASNHGMELEINGALTRNLSVMGSLTHIKMRDSFGRHVRFVSERLASLLLSYRFEGALEGLNLSLGTIYTGEHAGDKPAVDFTPLGVLTQPSYFIPSYTMVNAGISYSWSHYQVRLFVDNVADKKDFIYQGGARFAQEGLFTMPGRNFRLQATLKF